MSAAPLRSAPAVAAGHQDLLPSRYGRSVQAASLAAFTLAFAGWLNETWLFWFDTPIWLNRYTEYALILAFGLWRIRAEADAYTRRRLIILVAVVSGLWWLIPWLLPVFEPYVGYLGAQPVFPALHVPGTVSFFVVLALVLLFGRRVVCGFGCPCVGIRETIGFPFRQATLRSDLARRLRHSKWLFFVAYAGVLVVTQYPPNAWSVSFVGGFWLTVALTYFGSFFLTPVTGNRFYCRYLCPFGATFGVLNHAGFYDLKVDPARCIDCGRCEQACDMGIAVMRQGKAHGRVTQLEDCMGCARCVLACPTDAIEMRDVRNRLRPGLRRDASHLRRGSPAPLPEPAPAPLPAPTHEPLAAPTPPPRLAPGELRAQAARCLDCGEQGCRAACPLANRIPDWLRLAARGEFHAAAALAQSTNPLPEFCGALCPQERLCEGGCARGRQGVGAVAIGAIEHALVDTALAEGWRPALAPTRRQERRAAVVGAGPAGLAFADALNRAGWTVTVCDRDARIGGLMAHGLPPFRFDKAALTRRQALLTDAGARFELGVAVDRDRFAALLADHDAVFVGLGATRPRRLPIPGSERGGVIDALAFLAAINAGDGGDAGVRGRRVVVLGGGDTAIDCARAALRAGAATVALAYRGRAAAMKAGAGERAAAVAEGVHLHLEHTPSALLGADALTGVRCATPAGDRDLACDTLVVALGQLGSAPDWLRDFGVALADGYVVADADGRTGHPRIFAGGDCVHGPALIVTAAAAGRRAAAALLAEARPRRMGWLTRERVAA